MQRRGGSCSCKRDLVIVVMQIPEIETLKANNSVSLGPQRSIPHCYGGSSSSCRNCKSF